MSKKGGRMLRDEYLLILTVVYSLYKEKALTSVWIGDVVKAISDIKENINFHTSDFEKIQKLSEDDIINLLLYLEEKEYIKAQRTPEDGTILSGCIRIRAKGIDYIESPFDVLSKEYPKIVTASNITNIKANGDVNIIQSAIIQKNIQNFSDAELKELNDKLNELKDIISDTSLKEILEEVRQDLKSNEKINAAQKLSKFQNFVAKMRDSQTILLTVQLVYNLIRSIFNLL